MNISTDLYLTTCWAGTLDHSSLSTMWWSPECGDPPGLELRSLDLLITSLPCTCLGTGDQDLMSGWILQGSLQVSNKSSTFSGRATMSTPRITFCLTVCQDGAVQVPGNSSTSSLPGFQPQKYSFLTCTCALLTLGNSGSLLSLDELRLLNQDIQNSAFAVRTKKNLCSMLKAFVEFCSIYKLRCTPASGDELCLFATWLFAAGRVHTAQSVRNYLSAVRTWHRTSGMDCHTPTSYTPLNLTVRGLERKFSTPVRRMSPITPNILLNLIQYPANLFGNE